MTCNTDSIESLFDIIERIIKSMSDDCSMEEVREEMDDILLLQWMASVAAHPPVVRVGITIG